MLLGSSQTEIARVYNNIPAFNNVAEILKGHRRDAATGEGPPQGILPKKGTGARGTADGGGQPEDGAPGSPGVLLANS